MPKEIKPGMFTATRSEAKRRERFSLDEEEIDRLQDKLSAAVVLEELQDWRSSVLNDVDEDELGNAERVLHDL